MQDISFKGYAKRIFWVVFGLLIAAYGVGMTVTAELGVSPWLFSVRVLHLKCQNFLVSKL